MSEPIRIPLDQNVPVFALSSREPGTYVMPIELNGPAVYSTVFYRSGAGTLQVNWYEVTTGVDGDERNDLDAHKLMTTPGHSKLAVTRIAGFPYLEVIVSGSSVEFGVLVTSVRDFPSEVESGNIDPFTGTPTQILPAGGAEDTTTPGTEQTLISDTVPVGKKWHLFLATVICRAYGKFRILQDGAVIGSGRTSPDESNAKFIWQPLIELLAGDVLELKFTQVSGPSVDIESYLQITELDE